MTRTFLRGRLYGVLSAPRLLRSVEVGDHALRTESVCWDEYWRDVPTTFVRDVARLRKHWAAYVSCCDGSLAGPYTEAYFALLGSVVRNTTTPGATMTFTAKVLGFENFILRRTNASRPFAAATTSFRNPVFLSFETKGIRKNNRNDPSLLPLIVATHGDGVSVYFHYRKERLLKFTDKSLLFFQAVDKNQRADSFLGLGALEGMLVSQWGSRIEQRSRLLVNRALVPLIAGEKATSTTASGRPWRVLDIGSGSGLFASSLVGRLATRGLLGDRQVEMTLLDVVPMSALQHFRSAKMRENMSKVTYIPQDYRRWLSDLPTSGDAPRYDMALLCRTLHNFSDFTVRSTPPSKSGGRQVAGRYRLHPHMSDYYRLIRTVMGASDSDECCLDETCLFHPYRTFAPSSLIIADGGSVIATLARIADGALIEDSDLTQEVLLDHVRSHPCDGVRIFDLSRVLRLSVNHVYWVTAQGTISPPTWEMIWPQ